MEISKDDIKLITRLIAEKLGPETSPEKLRSLTIEAIGQLTLISSNQPTTEHELSKPIDTLAKTSKKLIVNAFGLSKIGFEDSLRSFLGTKNLPLIALSSIIIEEFNSLVAIIDYSEFEPDINRLKFELSELCEQFGFKTIVQDSSYYGN
jgi:predicted amino acid-binding ACT domain protein